MEEGEKETTDAVALAEERLRLEREALAVERERLAAARTRAEAEERMERSRRHPALAVVAVVLLAMLCFAGGVIAGMAVAYVAPVVWGMLEAHMDRVTAIRVTFTVMSLIGMACMFVPVFTIREKDYVIAVPTESTALRSLGFDEGYAERTARKFELKACDIFIMTADHSGSCFISPRDGSPIITQGGDDHDTGKNKRRDT